MNHKHKPQNTTILRIDDREWPYYRFLCFCGKEDYCRICQQHIRLKKRWVVRIVTFVLLIITPLIVLFPTSSRIQVLLDIIKIIFLLIVVVFLWKGGLLFHWVEDTGEQEITKTVNQGTVQQSGGRFYDSTGDGTKPLKKSAESSESRGNGIIVTQ